MLFLPPYSPFLNPIELSFNAIKDTVTHSEMYNRGDLVSNIEIAIQEKVTTENAKSGLIIV